MSYTHPVAPQSDLLGPGETFAVESPAGCGDGCGGGGGCGGGCGGQAEGGCGGGCGSAKPDVDMQPDVDDQDDRVLRLHIDDSLFATWTANQFAASSDWLPAAPVKRVRARWELRDIVGPFRVAPGFQIANRETAPGAFNNIGTQQTTEGVRQTEWEDLASYIDDKVHIRFGWVTRNSTGTALSFAHARGVFEVELYCGSVLQFEVPFAERFPPGELIEAEGVDWPSVAELAREAEGPLGGLRAAMMPGLAVVGPTRMEDLSASASTTLNTSLFDCLQSERRMPEFSSVHLHTQLCFAVEYLAAEWPATDCAPRPCDVRDSCELPSRSDINRMSLLVPNLRNRHQEELVESGDAYPFDAGDGPSSADRELFYASLAILLGNWDLARWAVCHVNAWSPEMRGLKMVDELEALLQRDALGISSLSVTFVSASAGSNDDATMWAFSKFQPTAGETLGFIVPVNDPGKSWEGHLNTYQSDKPDNFRLCVLVEVAHNILHEMIHIIGDFYDGGDFPRHPEVGYPDTVRPGSVHIRFADEQTSCWDESGMVANMFAWAMSQRYPCLADSTNKSIWGTLVTVKSPCSRTSNPLAFAYSRGPARNF